MTRQDSSRNSGCVLARLAPDQEVERAVGGLEVEALVLELLDALDDARGRPPGPARRRSPRARCSTVPLPAQLGDQDLARVADRGGVDVLERRGIGGHAGDVHAALVRERVGADVRGVRVRDEVEQLVEVVRRLGQPAQLRQAVVAHLELEVRDDRDEVRVAAALAVAVHRPLHHVRRPRARRRASSPRRTPRRCGSGSRPARPAPRPPRPSPPRPRAGSDAPFVSHSVTHAAPASAAARAQRSAYTGSSRQASKKCSAS